LSVYDTNFNGTGTLKLDSMIDLSGFNLSCGSVALHQSGTYCAIVCSDDMYNSGGIILVSLLPTNDPLSP